MASRALRTHGASVPAMPELPDLTISRDALAERIRSHRLLRVRIANPFALRAAVPPIGELG